MFRRRIAARVFTVLGGVFDLFMMTWKARKVCLVYFYKEYQWQPASVSFSSFPRDKETYAEWVRLSRRADLDTGPEKLRHNTICAKHFQPSDFRNPNFTNQRLKRKVVPSLNLSGKEDDIQCKRSSPKKERKRVREEAEHSHSKSEGHSARETDALGVRLAMEQDTSLGGDDGIKQDIPQDPVTDMESVYVSEEGTVSSCVPKIEVSFEDPLGDMKSVYFPEEKAVSLCVPKVEVSSEDPHPELYGVHQLTQINKSEEIKIEPLSPQTLAAEDDETKGELSPGCSKILPDTCTKGEIGQQAVISSETLSVHLTNESESPDDHLGGEVDLQEVLNSGTNLSLSIEREKMFKCEICNKEFGVKRTLRRHLSNHLRIGKYRCQICKKQFTAKSSLKTHMVIHTGERKFQCYICSKTFVRRSSLRAHLAIIHLGQKNYTCPVCSYKFSRQGDYQRHLETHTGTEKKFECPTCHKHFTRSSNLNIHILTHSGEKSYECPTCLKVFLRAGSLKRHLTVHTGEKNFGCRICDRKFTQRSNLNKHYLTHERKAGKSSKSRADWQTNVDDDFFCSEVIVISQPVFFDKNVVVPDKTRVQKLVMPLCRNGEDHTSQSTECDSDSHPDIVAIPNSVSELEQGPCGVSVYSGHRNCVNMEYDSDAHKEQRVFMCEESETNSTGLY